MKRTSRNILGRYLLWSVLAVVGLIVLLIASVIWLGMMGAIIVLILVFVACILILKAWEAGKFPFSSKLSPARRNIPYYQPSQHPYAQGYQAQPSPPTAKSPNSTVLKDVSPSLYEAEQPQAQYPQQPPPTM